MTTALIRLISSCKRKLDHLLSYVMKSNHCFTSASCIHDLMKLLTAAIVKLISRSTTGISPIRDQTNNQIHVLLLASSCLLLSACLGLPLPAFKRQLDRSHTSYKLMQSLYGTMYYCYRAILHGGDLHRLYGTDRHIHQGLIFVVANLIILAILLSNTLSKYSPGRRTNSAPSFSLAAMPSPAMTLSEQLYHRTDGRSNRVPAGLIFKAQPPQLGLQYPSPFNYHRPAVSPLAICEGASDCNGGHDPVLMNRPDHDGRISTFIKDREDLLEESPPALLMQKGIDDQPAKTHDTANNFARTIHQNDHDDIDADKDLNHKFDEFIRHTFARIKKESQQL